MQSQIVVCAAVISTLIAVALAYPTTVPATPEVCKLMTPGHGPSPQKSSPPYSLEVSKSAVRGGQNVQVNLSGRGNQEFLGFYIQARDTTGSRVGTFSTDDGIKVHSCGGIKNNAAHHAGKNPKRSIVVNWTAPKDFQGDVTFVATFVEEFETFWTNVRSSSVSVSKLIPPQLTNPPLLTDSRKEERKTTKATQESRILNYNPYTPFSPLKTEDFDSKDFPLLKLNNKNMSLSNANLSLDQATSLKDTQYSSQILPSTTSRTQKRKGRYIPKPVLSYQDDAIVINNDPHQDCTKSYHNHPNPGFSLKMRNEPLEENLPSYYNPNSYKSLLSPVAHGAGYYHLESAKPPQHNFRQPYNSRTIGNVKRPLDVEIEGFRPNFFPSNSYSNANSNWKMPSQKGYASIPHFPEPRYPIVSSTSDTAGYKNTGYSAFSSFPRKHGVLINDYVADAGIVVPEGMHSYQIPRYGYLVFNPYRGPPYYIIPAPDESSFEEAHFGKSYRNLPHSTARGFRRPVSSGGVVFNPSN